MKRSRYIARYQVGLILILVVSVNGAILVGPTRLASAHTVAQSWSYTGNLNTARSGHTAIRLANGSVLVAGGNDADGAELYDQMTGTWSVTGSLNVPRVFPTATLLQDGNVLLAGGEASSNLAANATELYDPSTGAWIPTGSLNTPRYGHTATLLQNGKLLVAGGIDSSKFATSTAELYDPSTGAWSVTGRLNSTRVGHTATLLQNGKVLVAGGQNDADFSVYITELYDPTTGTWSVTGTLNAARGGHTATLLPNGDVLVAGPCNDGIYCSNTSSAELYNPTTGTWRITGDLKTPRYSHTATLLPNGQLLIAGGDHSGSDTGYRDVVLNSAEIYTSTTGKWSTTVSLNAPREFHTATLLDNGKVLIAGGFVNNTALNSAELYDPNAPIPAPRITSALVEGKKLILVGENFDDGAVILLNGEELITKNDSANPQTTLIAKKAGKRVNVGDKLQVRNPNGSMSQEFSFAGQ